jgi:hemerythrin-like domain-containing protein
MGANVDLGGTDGERGTAPAFGTVDAIRLLRDEHEVIRGVLDGLDTLARCVEDGRRCPVRLLEAAFDFLGSFVDRCHHAKEEEGLFPVLRGRLGAETLAALTAQHDDARDRLAAMRAATGTDRATAATLTATVRDYGAFLRAHLDVEEREAFPVAEALGPAARARVDAACARVERRAVGPRAREALLELADTLAHACRASREAPAGRPPVAVDLMRPNVPRLSPDEALARAAELMAALDVRELPVVEDGRLVGILTLRDLQPFRGHYEWTTVRAAMTPDPVTVPPNETAGTVASLLLQRCFNAVPVAAGGTLLGMIARSDLLRLLEGG